MAISFQYDYLLHEATTGEVLTSEQLHQEKEQKQTVYQQVQEEKRAGKLGFTSLPYQDSSVIQPILDLAAAVRQEFKNVIIVGIGGSDLGTRAVHRALNHQFYNLVATETPRLFFLGDTTDPVAIQEVLDVVSLKETAVVVISKSGNTVEQMSTFLYLQAELLEEAGSEVAKTNIIILTDPTSGTLREIVKREGYRSLPIPPEVGGRFSVFTSVGLFPLAVVGVDIVQLLAGAQAMDEYDGQGSEQNMAYLYALTQLWYYQNGRPISVLMPYSYNLREVGFWFRQLWAESLGKKHNLSGGVVNVGPTPIAATGPTDQHSQVQLYMEGPLDKVFTFVAVQEKATNATLPEAYPDMEGVNYLKGHDFATIVDAEQASTAYALATAGRPSCTISLGKLDAFSLGQLLYFFELAVTYAGAILDINTFDQPGVELGKQYMYGLLGRPGFEDKQVPHLGNSYTLTC